MSKRHLEELVTGQASVSVIGITETFSLQIPSSWVILVEGQDLLLEHHIVRQ